MKPWTSAEAQEIEEIVKKERPEIWLRYIEEEDKWGKTRGISSEVALVFFKIASSRFGDAHDRSSTDFLFAETRRRHQHAQ